MILNYKNTYYLVLLVLSLLLFVSCTTTTNNNNPDQISNEAFQESQDNFNELKVLFEKKKYKEAYSLLDYMKTNLPYSRFTKFGKILEIHSYFEQNKFTKAIKNANNFINAHPTHSKLDYVLYLRAIASYNLNQPLYQNLSQIHNIIEVNRTKIRQTFIYFSELAKRYSKSNYFNDSVEKIKKLRQILAEYELNDAYILYDAAKYQESIKHINFLIESYPRSKSIKNALKLQAKAYRLLGQADTANSIDRKIQRNYSE